MSIPAASPSAAAPAGKALARWPDYALFTLCAGIYLIPFMRVLFIERDEGSMLYGAVRIVQGQVFARDFFETMGPGTFYWLAAFFKLFGVSFMASRICLFISSLGTGLSIYFLSRRVCGRYKTLPCLLLAGTYFGVFWPGISHHVDSNFFALLSIACMVLWLDGRKASLLIAAGFLAGTTTCILQPAGVSLLCAFLVWLWLQRLRKSASLSSFGLLISGYLAFVSLVAAYFWTKGALSSLVYVNFIYPSHHYVPANAVAYAQNILKSYWTPWAMAGGGAMWSVGMAAILIIPFLFAAALPAFLLFVGVRCKWKMVAPEIALYWLCGWALWLSEFHRRDIYHLVFGSPLLIVLCIHALTTSRMKLANSALQLLAISAVCLAAFNFFLMAALAHPTATRVGTFTVFGEEKALAFLNEHVAPGEEILVYPYCPSYYFLSATTNPTRYSFLQYNYNTASQYQEVLSILERRRIRYVIWDTASETRDADNPSKLQPRGPNDLIIEPYLESHYKLVEDDHGVWIMERKSVAVAK